MQNEIPIPKRIEEAIGSSGWSALSWALHNHWVKDYKWYFSELDKNKKDIGTPSTVAMMLDLCCLMKITNQFYTFSEETDRSEFEKVGTRGLFMFLERVNPEDALGFYKLMVEGYLLGTDFVSPTRAITDEHGANQLEGELRRYWADKNGIISPREVSLTRAVIDDYCTTWGLDGASDRFAEKLNL